MRSCVLGLALFFAFVARPPIARAEDDPLRHGYALIIGAWSYSDSRWPRLDDISLQVRQLKTGLDPHFDNVQVLPNPTFEHLETSLRQFLRIRGNDEQARLFIYYAGHGYTEVDQNRNEYRGYITGADTPYVDGGRASLDAARIKALSMEAVRAMVSDINARQVLFVFDSCFAGTVFSARSPPPSATLSRAEVQRLAGLPVREFITAGDVNERIPAHSPIPQLLLSALDGQADKYNLGVVTGQQIAEYLSVQARASNARITPRVGKLPGGYFDRGEFLFRVGLARSPVPPQPVSPPPLAAPLITPAPPAIPAQPAISVLSNPDLGAKTFLVFFAWQKGDLTAWSAQIVKDAAAYLTASRYTRIDVDGHDDTGSTPALSLAISEKRARTVSAELVRDGVPQNAIEMHAYGQTRLLVPTGPGVREPQNRRVEIVFH